MSPIWLMCVNNYNNKSSTLLSSWFCTSMLPLNSHEKPFLVSPTPSWNWSNMLSSLFHSSVEWKNLGYFHFLLDAMQAGHSFVSHAKFAGSHFNIWVKGDTVMVTCLAQESNTMQLFQSGFKHRFLDWQTIMLVYRPICLVLQHIASHLEILWYIPGFHVKSLMCPLPSLS